ncbi:hypothetical protein GH714_025828 [Hevea brasiliensis]|uniref:Uncharacterized protein n=1 Tax=Hevea brasiliensis TaxID=3981 RepID=A0A6A6MYG4_HEVBR|nr:hypothetical protein GH714_025828 [Hevea brasiliensis]
MEKEAAATNGNTSLFPLFAASTGTQQISSTTAATTTTVSPTEWLCNTSFTTNLSVINDTVSSLQKDHTRTESDQEEDDSSPQRPQLKPPPSSASYELLEEEEEEVYSHSDSDVDSGSERKTKKRKEKPYKKKKNRRKRSRGEDADVHVGSRKSNVRAWADSHTKPAKDYYFDSHGDADNLVYGSLYRMDVPRYKPYNHTKLSAMDFHGLYRFNRRSAMFDRDDIDALDVKLKSNGRYWSGKYQIIPGRVHRGSISKASLVEESWEDEVLRKSREFNQLTRENPHDEKVWLDFAEFQDRVAKMQPQKGARLQMLEKKISILEKAVELNPDNEELLLCLLKAYQSRDSTDMLIGRWEKVLMGHSGSSKLWKEYLHVVQGEFSRFKVSDMRKIYAHAMQALSTACSKQFRQAGYQELATALFQAEIEFSLFCPSLLLSEHSKLRLFEHFWNGNGPRVGEEGAVGWSSWLEKEEETRQKTLKEEETLHDDERGGWTGWSEPLPKFTETDKSPANATDDNEALRNCKMNLRTKK